MHGSILTLWLIESGLSRTLIGYIGSIGVVYAFNWAWAPFVDKVKLPVLYRLFGQRRSWILLCQFAIALIILAISFTDPANNLALAGLLALGIAIFSATLDVSVDAYRITIFRAEEMDAKMPYSAAMSTTGWWAGYGFIGGAIALALGGETIGLDWSSVYRCLVLIYLLTIVLILLVPEPVIANADLTENNDSKQPRLGVAVWFNLFVVTPFKDFFDRCGFKLAFSILAFLILFRLGEAMLGRMSLVFYEEIGFTTDQIAFYQKFFGGLVTAAFSVLGAMVNTRLGVIKGLFIGGVAMASANLLFALLALVGPNTSLFMLALIVDNFCAAFATVAAISFISYFTSRTFTGTQYALMASISNFGRTTVSANSGAIIDVLGGNWALFFVLTSVMVIPSLCLLLWVGKQLKEYEAREVAAKVTN